MDANKRKIGVAALEAGWAFMSEMANDEDEGREATDHRKKPRSNRRKFRHGDARHCINRDYLGIRGDLATPLLGAEFKAMLRECCRQFDIAVKIIYAQEYLRLPTSDDLRSILQLHRHVHQVDGLFGSLDCSHTIWKNCPKAWAGSYTGKPGSPSIILEAVVDYHMFFWHASYGYTGNIGDLNVLAQSPLLERMVDGSFHTLENEASVVPFKIDNQEFTNVSS
ncbi:plant transposon protein [Nitzschia inconspicua]|uniref:Plant transposon protein n=1 Tax=Nitzschia inconspicua TaxID=303405 RepID=A0A9K3KP00_9STRA|nr:plant transposon protein [Nitzschia inconspicua]